MLKRQGEHGRSAAGGLSLVDELIGIVGKRHVLTTSSAKRNYIRGYRYGCGEALAVVRPGSLVEYWKVVEFCVSTDVAIIPQAANTGLTGGSVPFGDDYDRDVVVINTMRLKGIHILGGGRQIVALPGTTLNELETALTPYGREPHSVIGSSCLGASVIGGICNNSGGSLIKRGPAYTELALYAQVDATGKLRLINHLGIHLKGTPLETLTAVERGDFASENVSWDGVASDAEYETHVRDINSGSPARFNADRRRLLEASGSAGKVIVFAVRVDTFEAEKDTRVFYIGTNDPGELTLIRRTALADFQDLPVAAEYIHRDAFDIAAQYGKDTYLLVKWLGTGRLPALFRAKSRFDAIAEHFKFLPANMSDRVMQFLGGLMPSHLPSRLRQFRERFEHHLMIKAAGRSAVETEQLLNRMYPSELGAFFECSGDEGKAAFLHRFATAGAAVRYKAIHDRDVGGIVALDIALPRNEKAWVEKLPSSFDDVITQKLYYGHFFCHVFHQDYIVRQGVDWLQVEHEMLSLLAERGAKYPAEHNVGHLYTAEPIVAEHYRELDPCNCFNPGIGQTSKLKSWGSDTLQPKYVKVDI